MNIEVARFLVTFAFTFVGCLFYWTCIRED